MRFFTSDTHFSHERIIELCNRPFKNTNEMNEALIANWNRTVGEDDEVFHLGDVALGPWVEWDNILTRLNGFKVLVVGNHDRVFKGMGEKQNIKFASEYAKWFDVVTDEVKNLILTGGHHVNLSHFPYDGDSHDADRYEEFRLPDTGTTLIHGHVHSDGVISRSLNGSLQVHVGVDAWDYAPVSENEIVALINKENGWPEQRNVRVDDGPSICEVEIQ